MTYGPVSSAANIGTSLLSTFAAPEISKYLIDQGFDPVIAKALAVAGPATISGGVGAATSGDKYGWMNAVPSGIMGYLSMPSGSSGGSGASAPVTPKANPIPDSTQQTLSDNDVLGTFLNGKPKSSISDIATQSSPIPDSTKQALEGGNPLLDYMPNTSTTTTASTDTTKAPTEGAKGDELGGIFGKLMSTPEGKMMVSMMLANTFSSLGTTAGTDAYYNKLNRQTNQVNALQAQQQRNYINKSLGYAVGGPLVPTVTRPVEGMYPQSMIPRADRRMGASQVRSDVVQPMSSFKHGELVGPGDGMSDSIPANIDGKRKAKVATGEYVVPREAAEKYGDKLTKMMKAVRAAAHPEKGEQVKQDAAKREFIKQMSGIKA